MGNMGQMRWKKLEAYMKDITEYLEENTSEVIDFIEIQLMYAFYGDVLKDARPLTFGLATLHTYYETFFWDESIKEEIVSHVSIVEEHCKNPEFIRSHLTPDILKVAYETVYGYGERLTEFNVEQQEKIAKAIDSLREHVVKLRHRG